MAYYYRYTMTENQIRNDIERGYGFRYYDLHETLAGLVENSPFIEMEPGYFDSGINELDLTEISDDETLEALEDAGIDIRQDLPGSGKWGLAYDGLSAFGPFETVDEAKSQALLWHYNGFDGQVFTHAAIVDGDITGNVDDNDIDTIRVSEIVEVIAR